ncbi:MFS transporter [Leifsonia poae]|uniref:MFS transporter n=1 Tax=Leifsonia poae TaxID=110933 RepID=UPI003D6743F1
MNVTAVMIMLQHRHGAAAIAVYFLARTAAPYLFSRPVVSAMPPRLIGSAWASSQATLALLMLGLALFNQNDALLVILLAVAGVLQSATAAWLMHIAEVTSQDDRKALITAISTGTSVAIVVGPALGGILSSWGGLLSVFAFDSATFAASLLLVPWSGLPASLRQQAAQWSAAQLLLRALIPVKPHMNAWVWPLAAVWIAFGLFGGLLTAIETPVFATLKGFSPDQIGAAISAYGLGGLVIFLASTLFGFSNGYLSTSAVAVTGVLAWTLGANWLLYPAFFVTGLGFALVNSAARVAFAEVFARSNVQTSEAWAWVNQLSLFTSVTSYLTAWIYFSLGDNLHLISGAVVALGFTCLAFGVLWDVASKQRATTAVTGHVQKAAASEVQ